VVAREWLDGQYFYVIWTILQYFNLIICRYIVLCTLVYLDNSASAQTPRLISRRVDSSKAKSFRALKDDRIQSRFFQLTIQQYKGQRQDA